MNLLLSDRVNNLAESETLAMSRRSRELRQKGVDVINLSLGEPDFNTPEFIKDAAKQALDDNITHYTPVPGVLELRQSISRKLKRDNNLDYPPEQIVVSTGAKQSLANVVLSLVNDGDEVILPVPYWVSYRDIVGLAGGEIVAMHSGIKEDFKVDFSKLGDYITPKTKLIIFSSPCNPSGAVYSKEELKQLADVLVKNPTVYVISDEIYEHISYTQKHESLGQFPEIYNQLITVNGVSKGFAMTGWRVGYIGAPLHIAQAAGKIQGQITSGTCSIAQLAAKAAVDADPSVVSDMLDAFKFRRDLILELLKAIPGMNCNMPEGAFYVFPEVSSYFGTEVDGRKITDSVDLCNYILEVGHVALVPGNAFGSPECIRISYAASESQIREAVNRIKSVLEKLNRS